jgi:hypothetical protein
MAKEIDLTIGFTQHIDNVVFEKKHNLDNEFRVQTLEEEMVNYSNDFLGIKVMSVALPPNYSPAKKTEAQLIDWLQNKVKNNHTKAYLLSLKYGEKLKVKLDQKEPYTNN